MICKQKKIKIIKNLLPNKGLSAKGCRGHLCGGLEIPVLFPGITNCVVNVLIVSPVALHQLLLSIANVEHTLEYLFGVLN